MTSQRAIALFVATLVILVAAAPLMGSDAPPPPPAAESIALPAPPPVAPLPPLPAELGAVLDNVEEARKKVQRLAADIVQDREVEALEITEQFKGAMKFEMPRLLRLELVNTEDKDDKRVYVVGKKYAYIYRPKDKRVERFLLANVSRKGEKSDNPFEYGLALDIRELRAKYTFKQGKDAKVGERDAAVLMMTPRKDIPASTNYARIDIWIDRALWLPCRIVQHKSDGEIIETFTLSNIKINPKWSGFIFREKPFEFSTPRGVDLIIHEKSPTRAD